jgi:hypothetical protein
MKYICNNKIFDNYDDVINYANYYFKLTKIILGIELYKGEYYGTK